ncbi:MAG: M1 family aminopeptidase [Pirellulales bacterium]
MFRFRANSPGRAGLLSALFVLWAFTFAPSIAAKDRSAPFDNPPRSVRSLPFDVKHTLLQMRLDFDHQAIDGIATHQLAPFADATRFEFDIADMKIATVAVAREDEAGKSAEIASSFDTTDDKLIVRVDKPVAAGSDVWVRIAYRVEQPRRGARFVTPDAREPTQPRMMWTQGEPEYSRYWYPCLDSPNERATFAVQVVAPANYFVLSNGALHSTAENEDGTKTWNWQMTLPQAPYLTSVVAGEFVALTQEWDGIPVVSHVPPDRLDDARRCLSKTPEMVKFYSETIGVRYPWNKYSQICVDEYEWGGMEHTTATTLNLGTLHDERAALDMADDTDNLISHELAHQWFGDLVTCKDWGEIWLNESFATYYATLWAEHDRGADEAAWQRRGEAESYFGEDKGRYRRPIVTYRYPSPDSMFDRHSYPKGGRVLHMLRYVLGDDGFHKSIQLYLQRNKFSAVETADLRVAIEKATGQGLNWFFDEWVYHGGHPEYDVSYTYDEDQRQLRLVVKQTQTVDALTPLFRMPIEIDIVSNSGPTTHKITVSKAEETFSFSLDRRPRRVTFDPRDYVLKKITFHKSRGEWIDQAMNDRNVMARDRAVEALAAMTNEPEARAALVQVVRVDPFWGVRHEAADALAKFNGDDVRSALLAASGDKVSGVRTAAVKSLANFAHDDVKLRLRAAIKDDRSYYVVAEALRSLAKIGGDAAKADLVAAMELPSHHEVILRAAAEGLAEKPDTALRDKLLAMLDGPTLPERRMAILDAVAKFGRGDPAATKAIAAQLDDSRPRIRIAAAPPLGKTGDPAAVDTLLKLRDRESKPRNLQTIDEAIEKLRSGKEAATVRGDVEKLREQNDSLRERVRKLEEAVKK